ncbi:MAG: NAD(P)-dependent oxidoreductase [Atribacterota bacterium]|nr:NAD(P)-dependent oxidoreductase [Atribacterota bacterium]MDD4895149.1 NAD(P)-dependent oxidoreductase [Atribacterota bacterium]MDD5637202.1 NAD(P)-dependent oxidoreductase [Atribacterota bacterium]
MLKILIKDKIDSLVAEELKKGGFLVQEGDNRLESIFQEVQQNEILIVRSATRVTKEVIDAALQTGLLKVIIRAGVGVDNIEVNYARAKGIKVFNTPEASSLSVAELALAHMFVLARKMVPANFTMRQGEWNKNKFLGVELSGKTLGIIGMGRIGQVLGQKAGALGMRIIYCDIMNHEGIDGSWQYLSLQEVLRQADIISIHVSAEGNDGYLIDEPQFKIMKKSAFIINTARGKLVNEEALLDALEKGEIAGAGIDVYCEEPCKNIALLQHERISVTPHIGASTREAQFKIGQEIIRLIEEYQKSKNCKEQE